MNFDWKLLEELIQERMRKTRLPGVSLALIEGEEAVYARGYGFRDVEKALPATPHTFYGIGSVTKSFTALAVLKLEEAGALNLEDPVHRFLDLRLHPFGEPVRVHHLLTHTSGLPALAYAEALIRYAQGTSGQFLPLSSVDDFLAWLNGAEDWVETRPGERWFYLNEGYILLGGIVEKLTGKPFREYVREEILKPLGMEKSFFLGEEPTPGVEWATPYVIPSQATPRPGKAMPIPIGSDGGLVSSVSELTKYLALFLRQGEPLVRRASYKQMIQPRVPLPHKPHPSFFGDLVIPLYAYGLMVQPFLGYSLVGHGGSVLVYTAYLGFVPERGLGVAVLANGSGYPMGQIAQVALALALGEDPAKLPFVRWEKLLDSVCGIYSTYRGGMRMSVRPKGGALEAVQEDREAPLSYILTLEEIAPNRVGCLAHLGDRRLPVEFRTLGKEVELVFERYKLRREAPLVG